METGVSIMKSSLILKPLSLTHASGSPRPSSSRLENESVTSVDSTLAGKATMYVSGTLVTIW